MAKSICTACGKIFKSLGGFDKHRAGSFAEDTRRCLTDEEMVAQGMLLNDQRQWIGSAYEGRAHAEETEASA